MTQNPGSPVRKDKKSVEKYVDTNYLLPDYYNESYLIILPRDPLWMFACWEVTDKQREQIKKEYGKDIFEESQPILRVHDITDVEKFTGVNSKSYKDVPVFINVRCWYIKVDHPGRNWCVELGFKTKEGKFIMLLRSNIIALPLNKVSDNTFEQWLLMTEDYEKLLNLSGVGKMGAGSLEIVNSLAKRWEMSQRASSSTFQKINRAKKILEEK
ncbi:MAG: DUF4912 domain-containing protein [Elusimicrobia bacterium]|nr:DUF4912 domain-containing protein [Elusimicrobiota bacterium]